MSKSQRLDDDKTFRTSDLYLASYLVTRGLKLWATDSPNGDRVTFILTPYPTESDLANYASGTATANVTDFGRALKTLKRAIFSGGGAV